jgi:subtilase family serine protease
VAAGLLVTVTPAEAHTYSVQSRSPFAKKTTDPGSHGDPRAACSAPSHRDQAACFAVKLSNFDVSAGPSVTPNSPYGYGPASLQSAYKLPSTRGSGRTVAIVDAYNDPNAESDLATYRRTYGLPTCTTANGCFKKVNESGGTSYPSADSGWAAEESLDIDMVSAICPNCHILLVEASSSYLSDLGRSVNTAVRLGARFVSNSYGGSESSSDTSYDSQYYNHPGVAITASTGDSGYGTAYPAESRYVISVGGTSLTRSSNARGWYERAWSGAGSGCSRYDSKPSWQTDSGCSRRTGADVSAVADPNTGVAVYDTYQAGGWQVYGGTSVSSPIIASTYALAGTPAYNSYPASYLYAHKSSLYDITSGSNGYCSPSYLCTAKVGYDGPTGLGTPNGIGAFSQ